MKERTLPALAIPLFLLLIALFAIPAHAQDRTPGPVIQGATDPYGVTFYAERDYMTPIGTWRLAPGMRMLRLPTVSRVPRSVLVGSSVGVLFFYDWNFSSKFHVLVHYDRKEFNETINPEFALVTCTKFQTTSPLMFPNPKYIPERCSIIIHRKDIGDWLGVELQRGISPSFGQGASYQFYPLPEKASEKAIIYPTIPSGSGPYVLGLIPGANIGFSWPYGHPNLNDIEVTLTNAYGGTFKFPDPNDPEHTGRYELDKYGISQPSALKIEYKGPFDESAYIYAARAVAPEAPNVVEVNKPVPPGNQPVPGNPPVPQAKMGQTATIDISGQWKNSFGWTYNITQQQDSFQWTLLNSTEKGNGTIKGYDLSVSWQGPQGNGSAQGKIIEVDPTGKATKILWSNGVQFFR